MIKEQYQKIEYFIHVSCDENAERSAERSAVMANGREISRSSILLLFARITVLICLLKSSLNSRTYENVGKDDLVTHFSVYPSWNSRLSGAGLTTMQTRGRKFLSARISFYPNSQSCFNLSRLAVSGDICPNPGPSATVNISAKCAVCKRTVAKTHRAVNCDSCSRWCHIKCGCVSVNEYRRLQMEDEIPWICPICIAPSDPKLLHSLVQDSTFESLHTHDLQIYKDLEPLINTQGLKVAYLNVNGLLNKMSEIRFLD